MTSWLGNPVICVSSLVCVFLLLASIKIFEKLWWTPIRIQNRMALQGIRGPSYRLIHGNTKEIKNMRKESMSKPKSLSHEILSQVEPHIYSWNKKYGGNFLQWHGAKAQLVIAEPELSKEVLNGAFPKPETKGIGKKLLGNGLARSEGEKWSKMRRLANHAFHGHSLKTMIPAMIASAETMLERWTDYDGKEIEVYGEFRLLSSEVISRTAFGSSYIEGKNIFEMFTKLGLLLMKNFFKLRFPGISKFYTNSDDVESEKFEKEIHDTIMKIVKQREEQALSGEEDNFGGDFLGLLLKAHHDPNDNKRISIDDIVDECKTFYFTGQETTNSLLAWTVFLLAHHTDWQEEARKEVLQLFGKESPNPNDFSKMKIMNMIINESSRLYPPVLFVQRRAEKEVKLVNLIIPADVDLYVPILALHHDSRFWGEDAHLFKPERFSEGVAKATGNNIAAFLPFGMGPRMCVGFDFAIIETKIALSMILQRYSFTLSPGYVHSPSFFMTLRPQHGIQVTLQSL